MLLGQLYEVCVISTILQMEEAGTQGKKHVQSCRVNQWLDRLESGLPAPDTAHLPGQMGNALPSAHSVHTRCSVRAGRPAFCEMGLLVPASVCEINGNTLQRRKS